MLLVDIFMVDGTHEKWLAKSLVKSKNFLTLIGGNDKKESWFSFEIKAFKVKFVENKEGEKI